MSIAVIGAGYVGLVTAACLAELGHDVACLEVEAGRYEQLAAGRLPIYEQGLQELVARNRANGRLHFSASFELALARAQFAFIAVPTPSLPDGSADTRHVFTAARAIVDRARPGLIIVVKSTVPAGTGDDVARLATYAGRQDVAVVSNPEFLRQGTAVHDFFSPDRIVIGGDRPSAAHAVGELYRQLDAPVFTVSRRSAELAKYASNALLATRISFINEVAAVCEAAGADIEEVAGIVGADQRIGPHFLRAGLGWGGSCFPKDVLALAATAAGHGTDAPILDAVLKVNQRQRDRATQLLLDSVAGRHEPIVAVLGLAFKPDTDDLRGSPAVEIIGQLRSAGVTVRAHDPVAMERAARELPGLALAADAYSAVTGTDTVLLATEWPEYVQLDWARMPRLMRGSTIVDGRNVLDGQQLRELGLRYHSFGRGAHLADASLLELPRATHSAEHERGQPAESFALAREPVADSAA